MSEMQSSRYEYKYLVSEATARQLRRVIQMHLTPDAFTAGEGYPVHSLYLDSPDFLLCQQTLCGEKNRFKLRVRFYGDDARQPIFLEVKRRVTVSVLKKRAAISRDAFRDLIESFTPAPEILSERDNKNIDALEYFCHLAKQIHARPAAYTSYLREAYESKEDNSQRVTFDRYLRAGEFTGELRTADWPPAPVDGVVFEMKFTGRFPNWMHEVAQQFELDRISVPKYVECVNVIEEQRSRNSEIPRRFILDAPLRLSQQTRPSSKYVRRL